MATSGVAGAVAATFVLLLIGSINPASDASGDRLLGWSVDLGNGEVASSDELQDTGVPE